MSKLDFLVGDPRELTRILTEARTVAVVGMSGRLGRASYGVGRSLIAHGYDVIPVNPQETEVLGRKAFPDLKSVDRPIDVVDVFRRPELVMPHVEEAIAVGAKVLWLQDGVIAPEAARRAHEAGLRVVMDRCMARDLGMFEIPDKPPQS
jgi:predicted CoA-binding protein